jgi:hypothetical protein
VPAAGGFEVAAQHRDELGVVEQHGAAALALTKHGEMLVVGGEGEVLDVEGERFAGAQPGAGDQAEQQPIAGLGARDRLQDPVDIAGAQAAGGGGGTRTRSIRAIGSASIWPWR